MDVTLSRYVLPRSVKEATIYLENFAGTIQLLALFREFFPIDWQAATASFNKINFGHEQCWELAEKFLELVERELFPINYNRFDYEREEVVDAIPFFPQDFDYFDDIEDFVGGSRFLLELYTRNFENSSQIDWDKLQALCEATPDPLSYLYDAMSVIDHSTGTYWLDCHREWIEIFPWTSEAIILLRDQWKEAQQFIFKFNSLINWLEENPSHQTEIITFWNQARI
ncbi:hypothetical protein [Gloeothece verrucosa]|uniref:Uncharacterized protein n=1 Tax=Gloeothece verrucosa (strain PCC 7822) TaxID=497965 RepID=E0UMF3_GLOV7|nr:hypothetical protein [Gloeothece verrucosa]ADN18133.1 hypothetical protein Cyan7822_6342 [Gloeothece verrucosa PCC 7822]